MLVMEPFARETSLLRTNPSGICTSQTRAVEAGNGGKYVVFTSVSEEQLTTIDKLYNDHYKRLRFMYLEHQQTLIVKIMASKLHEVVHRKFEYMLHGKAAQMGLCADLGKIGGARHQGNSSRKEPLGQPWLWSPGFRKRSNAQGPTLTGGQRTRPAPSISFSCSL